MRYRESIEKSAEYLRLALPLMTRQRAALHPISYAVWYEFVSGQNLPLARALQARMGDGTRLSEEQTEALYREHVVSSEQDHVQAQEVTTGLERVLGDMADTAELAGDQTARFDQSLMLWSQQLLGAAEQEQAAVMQALMAGTREMRDAVATLRDRLAANQAEIETLREAVTQARSEALVDALTGLANRRAFEQRLARCLADCEEPTGDLPCLVLGDIDFFKRVNDNYGHSFGDQVLKAVAKLLQDIGAPGQHMAARVGGEEFALLMPATALPEAQRVAERVRLGIAASRIKRAAASQALEGITLSLGVTQLQRGETASQFFERADHALYVSKRSGRNCVTALTGRIQ